MSDARIEAAAKVLFECDLKKARVTTGTYSNLRPYYEADARRALAAADVAEVADAEKLARSVRGLLRMQAESFKTRDDWEAKGERIVRSARENLRDFDARRAEQ